MMTVTYRWVAFLYRTATGSRRFRNLLTPVGAAFYGLLIFLCVMAARQLDRRIGGADMLPGHLPVVFSLPLLTFAVAMIEWAAHHFFKAKGTPVPIHPPPCLVTSGPHKYTRNPMITGVFALLFGLGAWLESVSLLLFFAPLFILIHVWELKAVEEPELLHRLGGAYAAYRDRTPMFFPKIRN